MWFVGIAIIIAFVAVCETVLFFAQRHPQFVAKLYGLEDLIKCDGETSKTDAETDVPKRQDEDEVL